MKPGQNHFLKQLTLLELKLRQAESHNRPALYLYQNDMRTPLFMLEGLCRIYRKSLSPKIFEKLYRKFKLLEDALGAIDYNDAFKEYCQEKKLDPALIAHFDKGYNQAIASFEKILINSKWFTSKNQPCYKQFRKIKKVLNKVKWPDIKQEHKIIRKFFKQQLQKRNKQFQDGQFDFNQLESGLHEFRRRIRWFSIYAHALDGQISLETTDIVPTAYQAYCAEEIKNSPFNQLSAHQLLKPIQFPDYLFFALSYLIGELGKLKDSGQLAEAIEHAAIQSKLCSKENSHEFVKNLLLADYINPHTIAIQAGALCVRLVNQDQLLIKLAKL